MRAVRKLRELEKDEILYAIEVCDGAIYRTASMLGIDHKTLRRRLKTYGVEGQLITIREIRKAQGRLEL